MLSENAVERRPAAHADADRGDLVLRARRLLGPAYPDADAVLPALAAHVEGREGADQPFLQRRHVGAQVLAAAGEVQHHVGHALTGAVIGVLAAAAGDVHRKAVGRDEIRLPRRGAGGVERRVLQQPDELAGLPRGDRGGARLHHGERLLVGHERVGHAPVDRRRSRRGEEAAHGRGAVVNRAFTMIGKHRVGASRAVAVVRVHSQHVRGVRVACPAWKASIVDLTIVLGRTRMAGSHAAAHRVAAR